MCRQKNFSGEIDATNSENADFTKKNLVGVNYEQEFWFYPKSVIFFIDFAHKDKFWGIFSISMGYKIA